MSKISGKKHYAHIMFILLIFMLFTFSGVSALLLAVNSYKNIVDSESETADYRNNVSYLREVVHQKDVDGKLKITKIEGGDAIVIDVSDEYAQYIYVSDGYLRELLAKKDGDIAPGFGEKIMEATNLKIIQTGKLLEFELTDENGKVFTSSVSLKTGGAK